MSRLGWIVILVASTLATAALAQTAIPDLRGTQRGESETIILGVGNTHHAAPTSAAPRLNSVAFTLTIDKQDGRRFSGTFLSARGSDTVIAVISRAGPIYMVDDDGYSVGTMLAPNRMDLCYLSQSPTSRIASCTELIKQPQLFVCVKASAAGRTRTLAGQDAQVPHNLRMHLTGCTGLRPPPPASDAARYADWTPVRRLRADDQARPIATGQWTLPESQSHPDNLSNPRRR